MAGEAMKAASGFQVYDLGVDVPVTAFIETAQKVQADISGVSALLTTTMGTQRPLIEKASKAGMRPKVKVMVGGAPATRD